MGRVCEKHQQFVQTGEECRYCVPQHATVSTTKPEEPENKFWERIWAPNLRGFSWTEVSEADYDRAVDLMGKKTDFRDVLHYGEPLRGIHVFAPESEFLLVCIRRRSPKGDDTGLLVTRKDGGLRMRSAMELVSKALGEIGALGGPPGITFSIGLQPVLAVDTDATEIRLTATARVTVIATLSDLAINTAGSKAKVASVVESEVRKAAKRAIEALREEVTKE